MCYWAPHRAECRPERPNRAMSCAQCKGIESQFDRGEARKKLRHYRRRGPDKTTRMLIEDLRAALAASDAHDSVLLDIGAGIGAIHHELLNGRVSRAVLTVAGRNLHTWTDYPGIDPEASFLGGSRGGNFSVFDQLLTPTPRQWILGLNLEW